MMQKTLRMTSAFGVLLLVGACGGTNPSSTATTTQSPPPAGASNVNPMPREDLEDGGTFTYPLDQIPTNFNYNELDGGLRDNARVINALMPFTYDNDATGAPIWDRNYLASEPTLTTDPQQVVTFEINPKAAWDDGTPMTWEDFYWQWKANNGEDKAYRIVSANGFEDIESVERGKDDREVIVKFKHRFADWQSIFNPVYPASTNKDPKIFNDGWVERPLVTAGAFKWGGLNATTKTITLVRNEKWWGEPAKLDTIIFRAIDGNAQIDALANGEVDVIDVGPDANKYHRALGIEGVELRVAGGPNFRHLTINGTSPVLKDVRVRRALALAIDRQAIARALLGPLGIQPQVLNNHIFMRNQQGYRDNSGELGIYNPTKAAELLDEAGWKLDNGMRSKDGRPLEINGVIPAAIETSRQEMELIQNMLAQVGVKLNINTVPLPDYFDKYVTPGQFDFTVFSWLGTPYPISSAKSIYVKPTIKPDGEMDIQQNYSRIGSDELDELFMRANAELDREKAIELANQADALIWDEVHSLTLYQRPELIAVKKDLANFGAWGLEWPWRYADIGWVKH